jgi:protein-disulfide isomerase
LNPAGSHTISEASDGKVTVVEFLDYQCPACHSYYTQVLKKLAADYDGRITFVTRNFPLSMHPLAVDAARAAEAAANQGKYTEMYHALYDDFAAWAVTPDGQSSSADAARAGAAFQGFAQRIGLDTAEFTADLASPEVRARVDKDTADGEKAGVSSTPTIFVNGVKFEPTAETFPDLDKELRALVDSKLGP